MRNDTERLRDIQDAILNSKISQSEILVSPSVQTAQTGNDRLECLY